MKTHGEIRLFAVATKAKLPKHEKVAFREANYFIITQGKRQE